MDYNFLEHIVSDAVDPGFLDAIKARADQTDILTMLDAEVQRTTSRLQRLREYRNKFSSPMYRLVPEILSQIFFMYAEDMAGLSNLKWTKLLLVCKRWYDVGISTPRLWSFVTTQLRHLTIHNGRLMDDSEAQDARDVRRVEAQRLRAGRYPLTLDLNLARTVIGAKEAYLSMFWDPSSLLSLTVTGQRVYILEILRAMSACQHPNLQLLAIHRTDFARPDSVASDEISVEIHSLTRSILGTNVAKLQNLRIDEMPFDWSSVQGLRALKVIYRQGIQVPFSIADVLKALGRSPLLEEVSIALPHTFSPNTINSHPKQKLTHLISLSLTAVPAASVQILQGLALSPFVGITVGANDHPSPPDSLSTLATCLGRHAHQHNTPAIRSILLHLFKTGAHGGVGRPQQWTIVGQCYLPDYRKAPTQLPSPIVPPFITLNASVANNAGETEIATILRPWPVSNVTQLDMRSSAHASASLWSTLFTELPALTTIIVRPEHSTAESLVQFLHTCLTDRTRRGLLANIVFDLAAIRALRNIGVTASPSVRARLVIMRALAYCAEVARTDVSMDTLEIMNEPTISQSRVLEPGFDVDWRELYKDLRKGFVYEGTLHNAEVGREDVVMNSIE